VAMTKEYDPERDGPKRPRPPKDQMYRPDRDGPKRPRPPMPIDKMYRPDRDGPKRFSPMPQRPTPRPPMFGRPMPGKLPSGASSQENFKKAARGAAIMNRLK
jgi:hypothetical protein